MIHFEPEIKKSNVSLMQCETSRDKNITFEIKKNALNRNYLIIGNIGHKQQHQRQRTETIEKKIIELHARFILFHIQGGRRQKSEVHVLTKHYYHDNNTYF